MAVPRATSSKEVVEVPDEDLDPDFVNRLTNKESARFLMRVLQKADDEQKTGKDKRHERASEFTGLNTRAFQSKSLRTNIQLSDLKEVERSQIHEQLIRSYLISQEVPITKALYHALYDQIPPYVDIRTFRKYLAKYGYVWLRLPNSFVVIERPQVTFDRYFYLRDITKYREEKRDIFYVDEAILSMSSGQYYEDKKFKKLKKTAASADRKLDNKDLRKIMYAVSRNGLHGLEVVDLVKNKGAEFSPAAFKEWIITKLLPILPLSSVVVIKSDKHRKAEKPTLYSIKAEMMEWLDANNIPYDEDMSKCDLMTLIDNYTTEEDCNNEIESVLRKSGHVLLQLPFSAEKISMAHHVFNLIKINGPRMKEKGRLDQVFDAIAPKQLNSYDENIAELEKETLQIDKKVDEILDVSLLKTGKQLSFECDSEVPLSDSD